MSFNSSIQAIVPAAGLGTRMRPLTHACPKELLPVGSLPVIHRLLIELSEAGVNEAVVVTRADKPGLDAYLLGQAFPLLVTVVHQPEPRGMGDALVRAREHIRGEWVVVALGDSLIDSLEAVSPLARMRMRNDAAGTGVVLGAEIPNERISLYGVLQPVEPVTHGQETFRLRGFVEKPRSEDAPSRFAIAARYLLPTEVLDRLAAVSTLPGKELGLTETLSALAKDRPIEGLRLRKTERRWDIGSFRSYFDAFEAYAARDRALLDEEES